MVILSCVSSSTANELNGPNHTSGQQPTGAPLFAGGDGSAGNPYQISNVTELQWMGNTSNLNKHFILVNDINASVTKSWNSGLGFRPVGDKSFQFSGSLDGQGYNISDLFINRGSTDYVGLFGSLGSNGMISNVSLLDNIVRGYDYVGGLAGKGGMFSNCSATGNVSGDDGVGGLAGYGGIVSNSYAICNVSGDDGVGGLAGSGGIVSNSYAICNVSGDDGVGGLVGSYGIFSNCSATGNVTGDWYVGGLVGRNHEMIENCYATGTVSGDQYVGGLVGMKYGSVSNSYATGNVSGDSIVGGLIGYNIDGTVSNSYVTGNVIRPSIWYVGGLVGCNGGTVENCNVTGNVSGDIYVGGLVGSNGGTVTKSYTSGNVSGNGEVGGLVGSNGGTVTKSYTSGNVSGNGGVGGLVGENRHGTVSNCSATGYVSGNDYVGGLVGINGDKQVDGTVCNSYATGDVSGSGKEVGGLVGENWKTVYNCYATGNVSGVDYIGGFVGDNDAGKVGNCYSAGKVTGTTYVGGFYGRNSGTISNCFFDIQTSGMTTSNDGIGKITSKMKTRSTFTGAGWDFVDTWGIIEQCSYPILRNFNYSLSIGDIVPYNSEDVDEDDLYMTDYQIDVIQTDLPGIPPGVLNATGFWSLDTNSSFLSINDMGVLNGTPRNEDVGIYYVNISIIEIWEIKVSEYTNFTLTVHNTNDVPNITTSPHYTATEEEMYNYSVVAEDDDLNISVGEILTYSLDSAPNGLSIKSTTGLIQWVPTNDQACQNHAVIVNVTDITGTFDIQEFIINVTNTNDNPAITSTADTTAVEDEMYEYQLTTHDDDFLNPSIERLIFSLDTAPEGMTIGSDSGLIQWLPTNDDVGIHWVNVTVSDLALVNNSQNFKLTVINVNDPPKFSKIDGQSPQVNRTIAMGKVTRGKYYNFTIEANDDDNDVLNCESSNSRASIINTGNNSWNISFYPLTIGKVTIKFTVNDKIESDYILLTWDVKTIPTIAITTKHSNKVEINDKIIIEGLWSDPDGDNIDEIWVKQQFSEQIKTDFYKVSYSEEDYSELSEEYRTGRVRCGVFVWEYYSVNLDGTWEYMFDTDIYNLAYDWYTRNQPDMKEMFGLVAKITNDDMIFTFKAIDNNGLESDEKNIKVILTGEGGDITDSDNDDIDDDWEELYFDDIINCSPNDDPDKDRKTNLEEYLAETNPLEKDEVPEPPDKKRDGEKTDGIGMIVGGILLILIIVIIVVIVFLLIRKKRKEKVTVIPPSTPPALQEEPNETPIEQPSAQLIPEEISSEILQE